MSLLSLKKFTNEKDRTVIKNIIAAFSIKGGALFLSIFTMPAYIRYFDNQEVLGLWFTVLSVMSWIFSFDLGIGNGLRNKLVESIVKGDKAEIRRYISSAYILTAIIIMTLAILGFGISTFIGWNDVFNIDRSIISEKTMLFAVRSVFVGILFQFLLKLITSILYALQKSAMNNLLSLISSIALLMFILFAPAFDIQTNLKLLSIIYALCVNIPLFIATLIVFQDPQLKKCWPSFRFFHKEAAASTLKLGGIFLWAQIMFMIITTTNEFFITHVSGPEYVVEYQVYNKLFTLVGSLFILALTPLWSAITKALNEKDVAWLNKTYKILNYAVLLAVVCELLLIPLLQVIINLWLGADAIKVNIFYALIFAGYGSVFIWQTVQSTIVCGMGKLKLQSIIYTLGVIAKFGIIYWGAQIFDSWIIIVAANLMILLPYCLIQPYFIRKEFNQLKKESLAHV